LFHQKTGLKIDKSEGGIGEGDGRCCFKSDGLDMFISRNVEHGQGGLEGGTHVKAKGGKKSRRSKGYKGKGTDGEGINDPYYTRTIT